MSGWLRRHALNTRLLVGLTWRRLRAALRWLGGHRFAAILLAGSLGLMATDLAIGAVADFWASHAVTSAFLTSGVLLVAAYFVFDEAVERAQARRWKLVAAEASVRCFHQAAAVRRTLRLAVMWGLRATELREQRRHADLRHLLERAHSAGPARVGQLELDSPPTDPDDVFLRDPLTTAYAEFERARAVHDTGSRGAPGQPNRDHEEGALLWADVSQSLVGDLGRAVNTLEREFQGWAAVLVASPESRDQASIWAASVTNAGELIDALRDGGLEPVFVSATKQFIDRLNRLRRLVLRLRVDANVGFELEEIEAEVLAEMAASAESERH